MPKLRRASFLALVLLVLLPALPCYAYGDPSGGALFQLLLPALAVIWGMWMTFANRIRRYVRILLLKLRGTPTKN